MKRFFASIAISVGLILVYLAFSTVVVIALSQNVEHLDPQAIAMVDLPLRAPKYAYYYFFPPTAADYMTNTKDFGTKKAILAVVFFITNVLLYAIPVFLILSLVSRFRSRARAGQSITITTPPEPPTFRGL